MEKSIFNFKIQYQDGRTIDLHDDKNLWVSSFRIHSPDPEHTTDTISSRHGSIYLGTRLKERKITSWISIEGADYWDFDLLRDELFRIFNPLEKFYIIRDLQPGKRMEVSVASSFDVDYTTLEDGEFQIEFVIHSVFLESVGTTQDPITFESGLWQIGQGLIEAEDMIYTHSSPSFRIYNAGDVPINPRHLPLVITYEGASSNLKIRNNTTGEEWSYAGFSSAGDTIVLDRMRITKNGLSIYGATNKKLITLKPGWNDFVITGVTSPFTITFNHRFYYL